VSGYLSRRPSLHLPPACAGSGQAAIPSLAPMLEKVLPAVVSVQVEGTACKTSASLKN
jgi:S1-C subfamily serine protease